MATDFERSVFINCPFDKDYEPILQAVLFCVVQLGFLPRIATETTDSGDNRLAKILRLIRESRYSIHDLSRCEASKKGEKYRLNMPFELGMDYGCRQFAGEPWDTKRILILEEKSFRYQAALSDLAGCDIAPHAGDIQAAVRKVRNWLDQASRSDTIGAGRILARYEDFQAWYFERQISLGFSEDDIRDYSTFELLSAMREWVEREPLT